MRDEAVYDCGCRNVVIRDIHLQKKRDEAAICIALNQDVYARSYYEGCKMVPQENITVESISIENKLDMIFCSNYPCAHITIKDTDMKDSKACFKAEKLEGLIYPTVDLTLEHVIRKDGSICVDKDHPVTVIEK